MSGSIEQTIETTIGETVDEAVMETVTPAIEETAIKVAEMTAEAVKEEVKDELINELGEEIEVIVWQEVADTLNKAVLILEAMSTRLDIMEESLRTIALCQTEMSSAMDSTPQTPLTELSKHDVEENPEAIPVSNDRKKPRWF